LHKLADWFKCRSSFIYTNRQFAGAGRSHPKQKNELKCVLIDEAQFLTKNQVLQLTVIVDRLNIPVLCYGLRSDFRAEAFEGSLYLLIWADEINEIKTVCYCGRKAIMNIRFDAENHKVTEGKQIEIGGNERYISVCRKHFKLS
jgi:thymidine kinase